MSTAPVSLPVSPALRVGVPVVGLAAATILVVTGSPTLYLGAVAGGVLLGAVLMEPRLGLFLTVATVPLEAAGRLENLIPGVSLSLPKIFTALALAGWGVHLGLRRLRFKTSTEVHVLFAYGLAGAISLVDAYEFSLGYPALGRYASTVVFYLLVMNLLRTRRDFQIALSLFVGVSIATFAFAIVQRYMPGFTFADRLGWDREGAVRYGVELMMLDAGGAETVARSSGVSVHAILMAVNTVFILPIVLAALQWLRGFWWQAGVWTAVGVCIGANLASYSRTGLLILGIVLVVLLERRLLRLTPLHVIALGVAAAATAPLLPDSLVDRVFSWESYTLAGSESLRERVKLLDAGWNAFLDHPWNGMGIETTFSIFRYYEYPDHGAIVTVHNGYLQVMLELGIPGIVLLLAFFWLTQRRFRLAERAFRLRNDRQMALICRALFVSLLAFLLVGFTVDVMRIGFKNMWLIMAFAPALHRIAQEELPTSPAYGSARQLPASI